MKNTPVEAGRFAFFSPLPMFFATCLWSWTVVFGIYFGLLQMGVPVPGWLICITVVPPLCCSPILGILGIIHGITKRKEKRAWLGILLSAFCLVENALLFCAMGYLSRFQHNQQSPPNSNLTNSQTNSNLTKESSHMKMIILASSCLVLIGCVIMVIMQIKKKKPITDPYLLLSIITFFVALRMICKILGV